MRIKQSQLSHLVEPTYQALATYGEMADGQINFSPSVAARLSLTPEKPYAASSVTEVRDHMGEPISKLVVVAFRPHDGTGNESDYSLDDLKIEGPYRRQPQIVPRNKAGVAKEMHLTLLTQDLDDQNAEPVIFDGLFDLMGIKGKYIAKIGELGQTDRVDPKFGIEPKATYTVEPAPPVRRLGSGYDRRFGDPHAVYSGREGLLQVCAFIALTYQANHDHPDLFTGLQPQSARRISAEI